MNKEELKEFLINAYYGCCRSYNDLIKKQQKKEKFDDSLFDYYQGQISAFRIVLLKLGVKSL